ncbi:aminoacyl-histidine dipeptidase [Moraxella marmotae]|uniref:aminoacyl-histidine dipeptidase n=1 Tax=Moraxella marmotae TaxID=3344520 RepID=UPI0035F3D55B
MSFDSIAYQQNLQVVKDFAPTQLWQWFARICATPHPSHHEEALANDIVQWATEQGLSARRDAVGNVIIQKNASKGYENRASIALQAHLDMVPQANADTVHDFEHDPIRLRLCADDDAWLMATGTTLGADNGIGMASCLAVLADDTLAHPKLEVLLTMTEETGMFGVFGLQAGELTSKIMINTDTEEIGEIYVGCAGGIDADVALPLVWRDNAFDSSIDLTIKGLRGGHSGLDIDKNRGNAIKLLGVVLAQLADKFANQFAISHIQGGTLRNAIPREAGVIISCHADRQDELIAAINDALAQLTVQLQTTEPDFVGKVQSITSPARTLDDASTAQVIRLINALPSGVVQHSQVLADTVETSLSLGLLKIDESQLLGVLLVRSLIESQKQAVCQTLQQITSDMGASVAFSGDYVGWNPDTDSAIVSLTSQLYAKILGDEPQIKSIHAGLECGLIKQSHPDMDIVSIGPTIKNAHSPDEMVNIASVGVYWQLLTEILANAPVKPGHQA